MGENGALCEIISSQRHGIGQDGNEEIRFNELAAFGAYKRIVRVQASPQTRGIPKELQQTLENMGYESKPTDDVFASKLAREFSRD